MAQAIACPHSTMEAQYWESRLHAAALKSGLDWTGAGYAKPAELCEPLEQIRYEAKYEDQHRRYFSALPRYSTLYLFIYYCCTASNMGLLEIDYQFFPESHAWTYGATLLAALFVYYTFLRTKPTQFPFLDSGATRWSRHTAKRNYVQNAQKLLAQGARIFSGPYNLITDSGHILMLPADLIDAINAEDHLSFTAYIREENLSHYETFRTMRPPPAGMFEEAVLKGITRALPKYTKPISLEMDKCLRDSWGYIKDWRDVSPQQEVLNWVGRLSTRIFLGEEFARNDDWIKISTSFTINLFMAMGVTKFFTPVLRPLVDLFSPLNRRVRSDYRAARAILQPEIERRDKEIAAAARENRAPVLPDDSIEWFRSAAKGRPYEHADVQIALAVAAIHTTTDLLCQALLNLCAYPETMAPLRQEAAEVLGKYGLQKIALTELRLLDSFFKETQRLKPITMATMHRSATADVKLPGGIKIRKGEHTGISSSRMWNEEYYKDPETFDAFRFAERRQTPGYENKSLLVATSPEHLGFAHGKHACPGRFFAANEVKIAFLHLLLKYDMRMEDPSLAKPTTYGVNMMVNPKASIMIKSRTPEVDLEKLALEL